jgi:kynurenine 3-monooxygenase
MNTVTFRRKVCVVGAGLTGSLLTIILAKRGFEVDMYEKRPDIRKKIGEWE